MLLRKRGFAEARPWGIASARCTKTYKEPTSTKCSVGLLSGGPRAPAPAANTAGMARDAYACYLRRNLACRRPIQFIRTDYKRGRGMRAHPSPSIHNNAQSSHALRPHTPTSCGRPPPLRPPASRRADGLTAPHAPPSAPPAAPKRPSTVRIKRASPSATFCLPFIVKSTWNPCAYPRKRSVTPSTCHQNAREASSVVAKMRIERGVCFRRNDRQARRHNRPVARQRV